ncbi:MAG TPA: DUF3450 family protein [Planctomycetota bacterium]
MIVLLLALAQADPLEDVLRQLREERAAWYQRQRARQERLDGLRQTTRRLEGETAELKTREAEADKQLTDVGAELATLRKEEEVGTARAAELGPSLDRAFAEGKAYVAAGLDYRRKDRLARLEVDPGVHSPGERLGRYWSFLQEELRVARSGEAYSAAIPLDGGRVKPARIFRVGHLLQGYVTEDGLESGFETAGAWKPAGTPARDQAARDAIEILDRRRAPALLKLPVKR